jgi:hypothetical protein
MVRRVQRLRSPRSVEPATGRGWENGLEHISTLRGARWQSCRRGATRLTPGALDHEAAAAALRDVPYEKRKQDKQFARVTKDAQRRKAKPE